MSKMYVIQWKSKVNGRAGRGTRSFGRQEAEQLAAELNRDFPNIEHEVVDSKPPDEPATPRLAAERTRGAPEEPAESPSRNSVRTLSFK